MIDNLSSTSAVVRPVSQELPEHPAVSRTQRTAGRRAEVSGDRRKASKTSASVESLRSRHGKRGSIPAAASLSLAPAATDSGVDSGSDTVLPTLPSTASHSSSSPDMKSSATVPFVARDSRRFTASAPVLDEDDTLILPGLEDMDFDAGSDADGDDESETEASPVSRPSVSCWKNAAEREAAIASMLPLIKTIASRLPAYWYPGVAQEDLQGAGLVGLIEAVDNFSPDKGCSLRTYCSLRIRGAMFDELRRQDWMPRSARRASRKLTQVRDAMTQELGREPSDEEICQRMGMSQDEYSELTERLRPANVFSLQESVSVSSEDDLLTHEEVLADPRSHTACHEMLRQEDIAIIRSELKNLPARHLEVMTLFYIEGLRTNEIAERFKVSESRISQIHSLALSRMRAAFLKRREA